MASCNRDVSRLRERLQVAGREEVRADDSESRAQFGRTPRAIRQLFQDVVRHLVTALLQNVWDSLGHVLLEAVTGDIAGARAGRATAFRASGGRGEKP